jgi:hypothetical protein
LLLSCDGIGHFKPMNRVLARGFDAESGFVAADLDQHDLDPSAWGVDDYDFAWMSAKD